MGFESKTNVERRLRHEITSEKYNPSHIPTIHIPYNNSLFHNFSDACKNAITISIGINKVTSIDS